MKKLTALLVLMLTMVLSILPAQAEVERSKLLDAAFSMLEEGNDFVRRYNEMTGAEVTATFVDGCPYFFGGKADDETTLTRLFSMRRCTASAKSGSRPASMTRVRTISMDWTVPASRSGCTPRRGCRSMTACPT